MNIAGIVVFSLPEHLDAVHARLVRIPGVEVHGVSEQGKLVVTVEHDEHKEITDAISSISAMEGVVNTSMVYQHSENIPSEQEATL
ncbi:MAG: chaperone NapD [Gammaproteobacteria bacterium]|nr:chaperone NapD [Gammaproteobacteria bacterium]MDH5592966.1 chaperone NapD [Gammaproteobacteria bacterium]MDH5613613.1 chaperone NapD [Gammaproteobacteria bacterium]